MLTETGFHLIKKLVFIVERILEFGNIDDLSG